MQTTLCHTHLKDFSFFVNKKRGLLILILQECNSIAAETRSVLKTIISAEKSYSFFKLGIISIANTFRG